MPTVITCQVETLWGKIALGYILTDRKRILPDSGQSKVEKRAWHEWNTESMGYEWVICLFKKEQSLLFMIQKHCTQIFRKLIYSWVFFWLASCTAYRVMPVEVLEPAQYPLQQSKQIGILDQHICQVLSSDVFLNHSSEINRDNLFDEFAKGIKYIYSGVHPDDSVIVLRNRRVFWQADSICPHALAPDSICEVCHKLGIDYLISLEAVYYHITERAEDFSTRWLVRLYSAEAPHIVDSLLLIDSIGQGYYAEEQEMVGRIRVGAWDMGANYARRILPSWVHTERRIYCQGKILRVGDALLLNGREEEAIRIWENAIKLENKTALRAGINLAWVYENAGEFGQAEALLQKALNLARRLQIKRGDKTYIEYYLQIIRQRRERLTVLEQQMQDVKME